MNENKIAVPEIPAEKFRFVQKDKEIKEAAPVSRPVGYFEDAMKRFVTNKGSVICFGIIILLMLYAFLGPLVSDHKVNEKDGYYAYVLPKSKVFSKLGFWDGTRVQKVNVQKFQYLSNIPGAIVKSYGQEEHLVAGRKQTWYKVKVDSYAETGWVKKLVPLEELEKISTYEKETGKQIMYPLLDQKLVNNPAYKNDQNAWFETDSKGIIRKNTVHKDGDIYLLDEDGLPRYSVLRMNETQAEIRVLYSQWYEYEHGKKAEFLFGADNAGYDIFVRLATGARLSLLLSICVAAINLFLGIIIGAIEGYYGGTVDLIIERIKDILYDIPSVVLMTLFQIYFAKKVGPVVSMFFAFIFFGWIGTSSTVRAQFYRFKGMEYVMASRTLGAKDSRLIFRHIFPNAIGFIITASVLTIPGVIFSEANLTYLGIVNLQSDTMTSVGTMLNAAQGALSTHPHCVFFPALFISILLICFNEFGNGLRDAFNPNLRGA